MSTLSARKWQPGLATLAAVGGLAFGFVLHYLVVYARDYGPSGGAWSLRGNGAIVIVVGGALAVLMAEVPLIRRRAWLALVVLPMAAFLGLFVLVGTI